MNKNLIFILGLIIILIYINDQYFIENFKEKNDEFNFEATPKYKEVLLEKNKDEVIADTQSEPDVSNRQPASLSSQKKAVGFNMNGQVKALAS